MYLNGEQDKQRRGRVVSATDGFLRNSQFLAVAFIEDVLWMNSKNLYGRRQVSGAMHSIDGSTKVYGIVGDPVAHSLSPVMHNRALAELEINGVYLPFPVTDISAAIAGIRALKISGVSVTIPHKETVMKYLDSIDPVAQKIGAVNTLVCREEDGTVLLHGLNTDFLGANRALAEKTTVEGKTVALLGAGGAARAIGFGVQKAGARPIICSRTESRGKALAAALGCPWLSLDKVAELEADILVNASSVGMAPNTEKTLVPQTLLGRYELVMDIVYTPLRTRLLAESEAAGCLTVNGLEMLLYQGVAQFELWTGRKAPVAVMRQVLFEAVSGSR